MTLQLRNVQVDVPADRYDEVVTSWAGMLGATTRRADAVYTHLIGARAAFGIHLQRLGDGAVARYHLDLESDDVEADVARLSALGATEVGRGGDGPVLRDPAGLLFCLCSRGQVVEQVAAPDPGHAYVDALVLDVPAPLVEVTAIFWANALRVAPFEAQRPDDPYLWSDGLRSTVGDFDLGVQRLPADEPARIHLDSICADVEDEVARLRDLGAEVVARLPRWQVLADPVGNLFCVVDSSGAPADDDQASA